MFGFKVRHLYFFRCTENYCKKINIISLISDVFYIQVNPNLMNIACHFLAKHFSYGILCCDINGSISGIGEKESQNDIKERMSHDITRPSR